MKKAAFASLIALGLCGAAHAQGNNPTPVFAGPATMQVSWMQPIAVAISAPSPAAVLGQDGYPTILPVGAITVAAPRSLPVQAQSAPQAGMVTSMIHAPVISVVARSIPVGSWQSNGISAYPGMSSTFLIGATGGSHVVGVATPVMATAPVANPLMIRQ